MQIMIAAWLQDIAASTCLSVFVGHESSKITQGVPKYLFHLLWLAVRKIDQNCEHAFEIGS